MTKEIERAVAAMPAVLISTPGDLRSGVSYSRADLARAAIASLLPPSEAMVLAACRVLYGGEPRGGVAEALTAAINAALGAEP